MLVACKRNKKACWESSPVIQSNLILCSHYQNRLQLKLCMVWAMAKLRFWHRSWHHQGLRDKECYTLYSSSPDTDSCTSGLAHWPHSQITGVIPVISGWGQCASDFLFVCLFFSFTASHHFQSAQFFQTINCMGSLGHHCSFHKFNSKTTTTTAHWRSGMLSACVSFQIKQ